MELCDLYLKYMNALCEGTLAAPEGIALSSETPEELSCERRNVIPSSRSVELRCRNHVLPHVVSMALVAVRSCIRRCIGLGAKPN